MNFGILLACGCTVLNKAIILLLLVSYNDILSQITNQQLFYSFIQIQPNKYTQNHEFEVARTVKVLIDTQIRIGTYIISIKDVFKLELHLKSGILAMLCYPSKYFKVLSHSSHRFSSCFNILHHVLRYNKDSF
jgi:hypothetical protein